jgi:DNA modification methylase
LHKRNEKIGDIMKIENADINTIKPYENNPRKLKDSAIEKVAMSLKEYGFRQPIVVDKDRIIVVGHTRYRASKKLGFKEVPITIADNLTPEQINAYRIADNRTAEESEWDSELLKMEIKDLEAKDFKLDLLGFNEDQLNDMLFEEKQGLTDEDEVPEAPEEPISKLGDIWKLGNHRLMCGDSTNLTDVDKLMNGVYPDLIHTDPPYGMNAVSKSGVLSKNYKKDILGDDNNEIAKDSFKLIYGLYPNAKQIWWGANYYCSVLPDSECWLVWDKNNGQSDQTDCELAWGNFRSVVRQFTQSSEKKNRVHPTQKPVSLMEWIIKRFNLTSKTIADYFGGSGSTLIAGEKHNLDCFIMEFDPIYCDIIIKRWENFTGKKAELENGQN